MGVLYRGYDANADAQGHWILGIGYKIIPGKEPLIVSIDPWGGIQREQTYNEFLTYNFIPNLGKLDWKLTAKLRWPTLSRQFLRAIKGGRDTPFV